MRQARAAGQARAAVQFRRGGGQGWPGGEARREGAGLGRSDSALHRRRAFRDRRAEELRRSGTDRRRFRRDRHGGTARGDPPFPRVNRFTLPVSAEIRHSGPRRFWAANARPEPAGIVRWQAANLRKSPLGLSPSWRSSLSPAFSSGAAQTVQSRKERRGPAVEDRATAAGAPSRSWRSTTSTASTGWARKNWAA